MYMNTAFDKVCFKGSVVSQSARFVYLCLCKHADNTKQTCFPSLNRIAQIVGKSISTIKRAVRELCCYGAIKRAPRFRKDGGQTSNLYEIVECDFDKLVEIPNKEVDKYDKEAKNIDNYKSEVELQNQDITRKTTIEDISFSVSDIQTPNTCTVEGKATKKMVENISTIHQQHQIETINTDAEDILLTVSDRKALNTCAGKEKEESQESSTAEQQEETSRKNKEPQNKSVHIESENNSANPINGINENVDEAEQIHINEKAEHEVFQDQLKIIVNPTVENSDNQTYNAKLDDESKKTNLDYLNDLSNKKSFAKMIKPISYIISTCKLRFITKLNRGEVTGGPPRTYPFN